MLQNADMHYYGDVQNSKLSNLLLSHLSFFVLYSTFTVSFVALLVVTTRLVQCEIFFALF